MSRFAGRAMNDRSRVARLAPWLTPPTLLLMWLSAGGWQSAVGWLTLAGLVIISAVVITLEVATLRKWGGWWGEKKPDGTPRWP